MNDKKELVERPFSMHIEVQLKRDMKAACAKKGITLRSFCENAFRLYLKQVESDKGSH